MANVFLLILTLHYVTRTFSETSFHNGVSAQKKGENFAAKLGLRDRSADFLWEDNSIPSNEIPDLDLSVINMNILRLHNLITQQSDLIQFLISGQDELSKENSKWIKRYKSTRRYLRKLNRACSCRADVLNFLHNHKKFNSLTHAKKPSQENTDIILSKAAYSDNLLKSEVGSVKSEANVNEKPQEQVKSERNKINKDSKSSMLRKLIKLLPSEGKEVTKWERQTHKLFLKGESYQHKEIDPLLEILPFKGEARFNKFSVSTMDNVDKNAQQTHDLNYEVDLSTGEIKGDESRILRWEENLVFGKTTACSLQGVVKIVPREITTQIVIDMWFDNSSGSVFDFRQTTTSNNISYGIKGMDNKLRVNQFNKEDNSLEKVLFNGDGLLQHQLRIFVNNTAISLMAGHYQQDVLSDFSFSTSPGFESTIGAISFGMNRVISPYKQSFGSGLCKVSFKSINRR